MEIVPIAKIKNGFSSKFGIPRQSGLCEVISTIVFEKEFNVREAFRGIDKYSHLWLLWEFSKFSQTTWSPTVRPPRLGGNKRVGVFATRSPHRPNSIGLSSVRLLKVEETEKNGIVLYVSGADIMDGTPIYDIKPYISYTDSHPDALCGFADEFINHSINVKIDDGAFSNVPTDISNQILSLLSNDPKPSYQKSDKRIYGMVFHGYEVKFKYVNGEIVVLTVKKMDEKVLKKI